jgi:lipopolysaccharide heptosyltransferase I
MKPDTIRRLLLIKPSSLGDIVHAMPTLALLRRCFPQAEVTWLVKRQWAPLVERINGVDRLCAVAGGLSGWLAVVPALRAARFDLVVDLQGLFRSGAMAWLSGCPRRIGFANAREGSPFFYTERVPVPAVNMHAVDRYLLVASALGAPSIERPQFEFRRRPEDEEMAGALLAGAGIDPASQWIAVNVSARWPTKRWPAGHFAALADRLQQAGLGSVVLLGGASERPDSDAVRHRMQTKPVDLTGQTPVGLLPALLRRAAVLVTNDSGPMHIAAAVGTPVVALFGPTDPRRTGPYGSGHRVLSHAVACRPCFSRECRHSIALECLRAVTPDQVEEAVRRQLLERVRVSVS